MQPTFNAPNSYFGSYFYMWMLQVQNTSRQWGHCRRVCLVRVCLVSSASCAWPGDTRMSLDCCRNDGSIQQWCRLDIFLQMMFQLHAVCFESISNHSEPFRTSTISEKFLFCIIIIQKGERNEISSTERNVELVQIIIILDIVWRGPMLIHYPYHCLVRFYDD